MRLSSLIRNRLFGFRLIEVSALTLLIALALGVYLAKVWGGKDAQEITRIEREIQAEHRKIRLLQAEVAYQEQPERIGRLSSLQLQYGPPGAKSEVPVERLVDVARGAAPLPKPPAPAVVAPAPAAAPVPAVEAER
jgi:hypothetical protein